MNKLSMCLKMVKKLLKLFQSPCMITPMSNEDSHHSLFRILLVKRRNQIMYKTFYSLAREPFSKDMRSTDAFLSTGYQEAINGLGYLQKSKGIGLVIGDPGAGKTFTLRSFKDSLNPALYHVVYFPLRSEEHTSELQSRGHLVC